MNKQKIITYNLSDNLIDKLADFIFDEFYCKDKDLSRILCVFGGKRPSLFLRQKLAGKIKTAHIPVPIFSIDEFINYIIAEDLPVASIGDLDACYTIYNLSKKNTPAIIKGRESFNEFLPWAREIVSFIEQLDLENIALTDLNNIQKSAEIGYEIPENINRLLEHIVSIRAAYHKKLIAKNKLSRGMRYKKAAEIVPTLDFAQFDTIIFCNFFYLHKTEQEIIKAVLNKDKGICIFQGSQDDWSVLNKTAKNINCSIKSSIDKELCLKVPLNIYQGFDMHSQVCLVREIVKKIDNKENTVIVLPRPETAIPLLSELSHYLEEFNVSMGYPLKRSPLFILFSILSRVQETKRDNLYYVRDYLTALQHPLIKNLNIGKDPVITRVIVHKIEEILQGSEQTSISGSLFLSLADIENEQIIFLRASQTLEGMGVAADNEACQKLLKQLHSLLFKPWENLSNFQEFSLAVETLLDVLVYKSMLFSFAFNVKVADKLYGICRQLKSADFSREFFTRQELMEIFQQKLESELISFSGSPLRGLQILGLLETRSLNFENVIIMDVNESILPRLKIYEPLIPREVMLNLGLNRLEKEEEIQRYQFMRLIHGAKNVHLVYQENQEKEKSRFIEELLWNRQRNLGELKVFNSPRVKFNVQISSRRQVVNKTSDMVEHMKKQRYSASRFNVYLNCPLQFYYRYVLGLREREDLLEGPEAAQIGTFFHELLEDAFTKFKGRKPIIDKEFSNYFFKIMEDKFEKEIRRRMKSDAFLLKGIITRRLEQFLQEEVKRDVAKIICLEEDFLGKITLNNIPVDFVYTADRIDEFADQSIVIIDYKTGGSDIAPKRLNSLQTMEMSRDSIKENLKSFQMPLYYHFVKQQFPDRCVNAELYNIRTLERRSFISCDDAPHVDEIMKICLQALDFIFSEIVNINATFEPDKSQERKCEYCEFRGMC